MKPFFRNLICFSICLLFLSCSKKQEQKEEQISVNPTEANEANDTTNTIEGNILFNNIATRPHAVILTGMAEHRLVSIYRFKENIPDQNGISKIIRSYKDYEGGFNSPEEEHFMPGIDILYGYNLLNLAHYDFTTQKSNLLFDKPVLVKTLYYPSFIQDSVNKKPINRNYFLVSVYEKDTNKDTVLNNKDLRSLYYFDASCKTKISLLPPDHSALHSQYDPKNDVMYIFAKEDSNKNGMADRKEPVHIFWISLKDPTQSRRMY